MVNSLQEDPRIDRGMRTQLRRRRDKLAAGEKPLGWKVGFGAAVALARLALKAPLIGYLTDRARLPSGAKLSLAGWTGPVVEPEIAVHVGKDLVGPATREAAVEAIAGLGPALELADVDHAPDDVEAILAGNIYQRHVVLGACDPSRAGGRLEGLSGRVFRNRTEAAFTAQPQEMIGDLIDIVCHVANTLTDFGETLRAGEVIITGSIVPPLAANAGEELTFVLAPAGTVSVRFG